MTVGAGKAVKDSERRVEMLGSARAVQGQCRGSAGAVQGQGRGRAERERACSPAEIADLRHCADRGGACQRPPLRL